MYCGRETKVSSGQPQAAPYPLARRPGRPISKKYKFPEKSVDKSVSPLYNIKAVREQPNTFAAIAQPVERILGKDEVASSNLASSSKDSQANRLGSLSFIHRKNWRPHPPNCQRQFIFSKKEVVRLPAGLGPLETGWPVQIWLAAPKTLKPMGLGVFRLSAARTGDRIRRIANGNSYFQKRGRKASSGPRPLETGWLVQIWLAAPMPLKSSGFRGFLLLSTHFRKKTLDFSDLKNIARPHPFLSLLNEGMRSYFGQKTQDE